MARRGTVRRADTSGAVRIPAILSIVFVAVAVTALTQFVPLLVVAGIPVLVKGARIAYNIGGDGDRSSQATRWRATPPW